MVDPVVMMLDNMVEEDPFAFALAKKKYEDGLFQVFYDDNDLDTVPVILCDGSGGLHEYNGISTDWRFSHTGRGFF